MAERSSGVRELSVIGIGTSTPTIKSSGNLNIDASTVAIGATLTVGDKLQLLGNSTSLAGTAGTSGDIRMFYGSPFIHDGIAWREFPLKEGVPVTESADTDWDDVIYRNDFNTSFTDQKFSYAPSVATNSYLVGAPVKFGEKSLRLNNTSDFRYDHRSDYVFAGPWTIEGWFYFNTLPTQTGGNATALISKTAGSSNDWAIIVEQGTTTTKTDFKWYNTQTHGTNYSGTKIGVEDDVNLINQWNHIAIVRESSDGSIHFYLNGVESNYTASGSGVIDNNIVDHISYELIFGNSYLHSTKFNGCIDDLRISTVARYLSADGSFTPPTEPYPTTGTLSGPVDPPYFGSTLEKVIAGTAISSFSNVSDATPSSGQVLKWNGSLWAPASDNTSAGGTGIGLTDLSISTNPVGINSLSYDDTTGTFTFTPTSLVGYATEGYVDNAVVGIATTGYVDNAIVGFITSGASAAE